MECPTPSINKTILERQSRDTDEPQESLLSSFDDLVNFLLDTSSDAGGGLLKFGSGDASVSQDSEERVPIGFIMDGVTELLRWSDYSQDTLKYYPDPEYETFDNGKSTLSGRVLQLTVS